MRQFDLTQIQRNLRSCPYKVQAAVRLNQTQKSKKCRRPLGKSGGLGQMRSGGLREIIEPHPAPTLIERDQRSSL